MVKNIKEKKILESRIVHIAHIIDKNLTANPDKRQEIENAYGAKLESLLREWSEKGLELNPLLKWAKDVNEELKSGHVINRTTIQKEKYFDIMSVILSRRSVRLWNNTPVSEEKVEKMIEAARWAPSSGNRQSVRIVVATAEDCKDAIVCLKETFLRKAPIIILVGVDMRVYKSSEEKTLAYLDAGAAIQNMILSGHAEGLGCIWSKLDKEDWQVNPDLYFMMKAKLRLPNSFLPVSVVGVGWPAKPPRVPPRHDLEKFVRFNDQGFPPDDYPEWRPEYLRLFINKVKRRLLNKVRRVLRINK